MNKAFLATFRARSGPFREGLKWFGRKRRAQHEMRLTKSLNEITKSERESHLKKG